MRDPLKDSKVNCPKKRFPEKHLDMCSLRFHPSCFSSNTVCRNPSGQQASCSHRRGSRAKRLRVFGKATGGPESQSVTSCPEKATRGSAAEGKKHALSWLSRPPWPSRDCRCEPCELLAKGAQLGAALPGEAGLLGLSLHPVSARLSS